MRVERTMKSSLHPSMARSLSLAIALALVTVPSIASAAGACEGYLEQKLDAGQAVQFCDDALVGPDVAPLGTTIRRPPGAVRVGLIRPRLHFIAEMLKSVENL
jgi:hypothetical protein